MNKNQVVFFVFSFIFFFSTYAQELQISSLSQKRIASKQLSIKKKLAADAKIRNVLVVAGASMTLLSTYKLVREFFNVMNVVPLAQEKTNAITKTTGQKAWSFFKSFCWFSAETAGAIAVNDLLNILISNVMYDESLAWWLTTYAPFIQALELMEDIAFQIEHAMTPADAQRHQKRFVQTALCLVTQLESVMAFMKYKSGVGEAHNQQLKIEVILVANEHCEAFTRGLQDMLADGVALRTLLKEFKYQFNQDLVRFAYIDQ